MAHRSSAEIAGPPPSENLPQLTDGEFALFSKWLLKVSGIALGPHKKPLIVSRLQRRLIGLGFERYGDYLNFLVKGSNPEETQTAVDLLTTNETYFFREPRHFDFLGANIGAERSQGRPIRVWSAASSSGEEAYTIAMVLAETIGMQSAWEVLGTDISARVLAKARRGVYAMDRASNMPVEMLRRYCQRGIGTQSGRLRVSAELRKRVTFLAANLNESLPEVGEFSFIFLRNVMIYFNNDTKRKVLDRVVDHLLPGGYLFISHSESLHGVYDGLKPVAPAIYRRPELQRSTLPSRCARAALQIGSVR